MRIKKRIGAFFLMFSLLVPVFVVGLSPRAGAIAGVDDLSIAMLAFSVASGFSYDVTGLSGKECGDWLANDALPTYLKQNGFQSKDEWWGNAEVESYPLTGKVVFGKMAVQLLSDFFSWITGEYEVAPGGGAVPIYTSDTTKYLLADGTPFVVFDGGAWAWELREEVPPCTVINYGEDLHFMSGAKFIWQDDYLYFYDCTGKCLDLFRYKIDSSTAYKRFIFLYDTSPNSFMVGDQSVGKNGTIYNPYFSWDSMRNCPLSRLGEPAQGGSLSISASETLTVPDASTMTEDDVYTIAANVTAETQEEYYQKVLEAIAANSFSATAVTDVPDVPDVPVEGDTTILGVVSNIWEGIKSIPQKLSSLGDFIVSGVTGFLDIIIGILRGIWEAILDFPALLQGIWDAVLDIPQAIGRVFGNVLEKIKELALSLVIPSEATITAIQATFMEKFPIIPDLKSFLDGLGDILKNPLGSAEQLALTPFVNLGNKAGGEYGSAVVNFLDFTWYVEKYKPTVDRVILGVCWCVALWNIHGQVSAVIAGHAVGSMVSADSVPDGALTSKKRGRDG